MKKITLILLLAMAALAQDTTTGAKKYNPATGTWVDAFPPGNAVQIGSIPVSDTAPTLGQILTFDGGSWVPKSPAASVTVGGDLSGTAAAAVVTKIRGVPVGPFTPVANQVLVFDGVSGMYLPQNFQVDAALYGDLAGTASAATVVAINGIAVDGTAPQNNYVMQYDSGLGMWTSKPLPSGNPTLGGDLSGVASSGLVVKLRGISLSATVPSSGQLMGYNGSVWGPVAAPTFNPSFGGDVSGYYGSITVAKLQGYQISNQTPTDGQVLKYNAIGSQWVPQSPSVPWSAVTGKPTIPTMVSQLTNDSGYITGVAWTAVTGKPTAVSAFTNDAGYLTSVPAQTWASVTGKPTAVSAWTNDSGYLTGASSLAWAKVTGAPAFLTSVPAQDWSTITSKPTIPTTTSQLTNNSGFLTSISGSGASLTSNTVPLAALVSGSLNQQLVFNGTSWAGKDDTREFSYVIQDTANDLTTTTGSVATIMTNAQATGWTILAVYCQADSGTPTFNIAIAGTNLYSSAQTCTTTNTAFNTFAAASVASAAALSHNTIAASTGNKRQSITIKYKQL
jgi:hypothetical protein